MELVRFTGNPVLSPSQNWWEEDLVFNPGAAIFNDKIYLIYRAQGRDRISRFGLAISEDGVNFERFKDPIFEGDENNKFERLGVEDPRITKIDNLYYIFYTSASVYPSRVAKTVSFTPSLSSAVPWRVRTSLLTTNDFKNFNAQGIVLPDLDSKNAAAFSEKINGDYYLLHRVYPNVHLAKASQPTSWQDLGVILEPRKGFWDSERVGIGCPPLKTEKGWVVFYHGVDDLKVYRAGLLVLDIQNPSKVLYRSPEPVFEPKALYEKEGYVNNVVFVSGVVEKNGYYLVYYGAGDKVIGLASINKNELQAVVNV